MLIFVALKEETGTYRRSDFIHVILNKLACTQSSHAMDDDEPDQKKRRLTESPSAPDKKEVTTEEEEEDVCVICLSELQNDAAVDPCGHALFCFPCILCAFFGLFDLNLALHRS